jgi:hypothetical protein
MFDQAPSPRGISSYPPHDEALISAHIYMFNGADLTTHSMTYNTPVKPDKEKVNNGTLSDPSPSSISPPSESLQIEKPTFNSILRPPKSTICKSNFNPSSCDAQNYNILEDLAQAPCVMSTLEVLQHCPSQCRILLAAIGTFDPESSNNIMFNLDNFNP